MILNFHRVLLGFAGLSIAFGGDLVVTPEGVALDAGPEGRLTILPPQLMKTREDYDAPKPVFEARGPASGIAKYADGSELAVTVSDARIRWSFARVPKGAYGLRFSMLVPINYAGTGKFAFGDGGLRAFPEKRGGQFLYQGEERPFRMKSPSGMEISLRTQQGWQELQDNRAFGWPVFCYLFTCNFGAQPGVSSWEFEMAADPPVRAARKILVDRFGQSTLRAYSGKLVDEEELKRDAAAEAKGAAVPPEAPRDAFGGLPGSGERYGLRRTGYFHLEKAAGRDVLVTPEGNLFFQLGVCSLQPQDDYTLARGREEIFEWLPPRDAEFSGAWLPGDDGVVSFYVANWILKFGGPFDIGRWLPHAVARLRHWGFNSSGAFSGRIDAAREPVFPCTPMLPLEHWMTPGLEPMPGIDRLFDPFAPDVEDVIDRAFKAKVSPHAKNPFIIGWFIGNEQLFENVPRLVPLQKAVSPSKRRLVGMLREKYDGDIEKFNAAWEHDFADFAGLADAALLPKTPAAAADMREFARIFLEAYYSTIERVFRRHDPNHLLLGSRWQPGTAGDGMLVGIATKYVDVISVNYYTYAIDEDFLRRIHRASGGRPLLLSEWHYTSGERGMGGLKEVAGQKERGLAYRNYVENAASLPFVVGVQWFSYVDQAVTGRWFEGFNGEAANIGLVDVADRPYREFVEECKKTNDGIYEVILGGREAFHYADPRFRRKAPSGRKTIPVPRALPGMKLNGSADNWPGTPPETLTSANLVLGPPEPDFHAAFRLCWDEENLYLLAEVRDATPLHNPHQADALWQGDGVEIFLGAADAGEPGPLRAGDRQILFGANMKAPVHVVGMPVQPVGLRAVVRREADGYVIEAAVPWTVLGARPEPGREFLFDLAVDNAAASGTRLQQWVWNGGEHNSTDRGKWGRARLTGN